MSPERSTSRCRVFRRERTVSVAPYQSPDELDSGQGHNVGLAVWCGGDQCSDPVRAGFIDVALDKCAGVRKPDWQYRRSSMLVSEMGFPLIGTGGGSSPI